MGWIDTERPKGVAPARATRLWRRTHAVQLGETPPDSKVLKGFGGSGVLELIEDHKGDTYRAVYTVRFTTRVYVLHVFQKKSKRGIATPQKDIELIRSRLRWAEQLYSGRAKEG